MEKKYVYLFSEGNASMKNLLGGNGANLAEMTNLEYLFHKDLQLPQSCTKIL
jgi:phosphoenolpyruvate synthase/pyruvate phosphate dikinase